MHQQGRPLLPDSLSTDYVFNNAKHDMPKPVGMNTVYVRKTE